MYKKMIVGASVGLMLAATVAYADTTSPTGLFADGFYQQWTPSSGTAHYSLVNESPCDGNTTYNSTNAVGNRDSYVANLAQVPSGAQITQIDITPCAAKNKSGPGNSTMNVFYRLAGVQSADAGNYALSGTSPTDLAASSFTGLSVIRGVSTSLELGAVLSSGTKGARLSRIYAVVTYTPLAAPSSLTASAPSPSEVDLAWNDNSTFEDGFSIERRNVTASSTFAVLATTTANVTSFNDTSVASGTTYDYRVRAFDIGGSSGYSNTAEITTP